MEKILSEYVVSVSELKKQPTKIIQESQKHTVSILNHNKPIGYIISAERYKKIMEQLEENIFEDMVGERLQDIDKAEDFDL